MLFIENSFICLMINRFWSNEPYRKTFLLYDCLEDPSKLDQKEEEE